MRRKACLDRCPFRFSYRRKRKASLRHIRQKGRTKATHLLGRSLLLLLWSTLFLFLDSSTGTVFNRRTDSAVFLLTPPPLSSAAAEIVRTTAITKEHMVCLSVFPCACPPVRPSALLSLVLCLVPPPFHPPLARTHHEEFKIRQQPNSYTHTEYYTPGFREPSASSSSPTRFSPYR